MRTIVLSVSTFCLVATAGCGADCDNPNGCAEITNPNVGPEADTELDNDSEYKGTVKKGKCDDGGQAVAYPNEAFFVEAGTQELNAFMPEIRKDYEFYFSLCNDHTSAPSPEVTVDFVGQPCETAAPSSCDPAGEVPLSNSVTVPPLESCSCQAVIFPVSVTEPATYLLQAKVNGEFLIGRNGTTTFRGAQ